MHLFWIFGIGLLAVFLALPFIATAEKGHSGQGFGIPFVESVIAKMDGRKRPKVVELWAEGGVCMAEATYEKNEVHIHLLVMSKGEGMRNLGYVKHPGVRERLVTTAFLMIAFEEALKRHCLPLIVPGYAST